MRNRPLEISLNHPRFRVQASAIRRTLNYLDAYYRHRAPEGYLSIAYVTNAVIAEIHRDFMDDPTPTDVITFPGDPPEEAGEICISVDYALRAAQRFRTSPAYELTLYLVHGWLHLAGFDDRSLPEKRRMRSAEKELMSYLQRKRAWIPFETSVTHRNSCSMQPSTPSLQFCSCQRV